MKNNKAIFSKVEQVARQVINDLRNKGYIVPIKNANGSIRFNDFVIEKSPTGFYSVKGINGLVYVEQLNLPQSAAIIANDLALGKTLNRDIIKLDQEYGWKTFDEELFKKNVRNKKLNIDQLIHNKTRLEAVSYQAKQLKNTIDRSFLKLSYIR